MSFEGIVLLTSVLVLTFLLSHDNLPPEWVISCLTHVTAKHMPVSNLPGTGRFGLPDSQGCRDLRALRQPTDNHVTVFSEEKRLCLSHIGSWR